MCGWLPDNLITRAFPGEVCVECALPETPARKGTGTRLCGFADNGPIKIIVESWVEGGGDCGCNHGRAERKLK